MIGLAPAAQRQLKARRVREALARYPALASARLAPLRAASSPLAYRRRAKLAVGPGARVGLYGRGGHEVVDLPRCRVLAPALAGAAAALRRLLAAPPPGTGPVLRADGEEGGRLRAVDLRAIHGSEPLALLVTLVLRAPEPDAACLAAACDALARSLPGLRGVALSLHDGRSPKLLGASPRALWGVAAQRERLRADRPWTLAGPGAFAQAHADQAAALEEQVERWLGPLEGRRVLDAYAGSGGLGLALAARGADVELVEAYAPAAEAARRAAREQGLATARVRRGTAETWLPRLRAQGARFDAALVNPPRRGLAPRVREALAAVSRGPLVYVSCDPGTLARDLDHLARLGLRTHALAPFDLMPLTEHVECVALLRPAPPPAPRVVGEDEDWLAVDKPPFLPTVPHPQAPASLLEAVRRLPGAASAVALQRLDAGTSGVCLFARSPGAAAALGRRLASARKRYLALVRGVARPRGRIGRALREAGRVREAHTRYRRLEVVAGHALLEVWPHSGRTHQIRRQLAAIGEPVLGDVRHGHAASNRHLFERYGLDRPFLHCASVELPDPCSGAARRLEAPLAPDLAAVLERLRARSGARPGAGAA